VGLGDFPHLQVMFAIILLGYCPESHESTSLRAEGSSYLG
jgi:hypothetical protein